MNEINDVIIGITKNTINNTLAVQEHHFVSTVFASFFIWFHEKLTHNDSPQ